MSEKVFKICAVTGSRAEYGLQTPLFECLESDQLFDLQLVVTGTHLSALHGMTAKQIEEDNFEIVARIESLGADDSKRSIAQAIGAATGEFATAFDRIQPDLVIVYGDRYEMFAAAQAAYTLGLRITHIAGGDTTEGAFDEGFRHGISKMAHLHFPTHDEAAARLRQLGENPLNVFSCGHLGMDVIKNINYLTRSELADQLGIDFKENNLLVTFHPVTLGGKTSSEQFEALLAALNHLPSHVGIIFTKPNADPEGLALIKMLEEFEKKNPNRVKCFDSLGQLRYLSLMKECDLVVGNSSSGLYEAPVMQKVSINIGERQKGRFAPSSVVHCESGAKAIALAIEKGFKTELAETSNPFGDGKSARKIAWVIKESLLAGISTQKRFYRDSCIDETQAACYVIAEAGVNHNGSVIQAKKLIDVAVAAGADAVKFQTFKAEKLATQEVKKTVYQEHATGKSESAFEMLKKLELSDNEFLELKAYADEKGIEFLSTPFDLESLRFLVQKAGIKKVKIPSGEITNAPLLLDAAQTGLPVILSTGMATLEEIKQALSVLAFGYLKDKGAVPCLDEISKVFFSRSGRQILRENVTVLHCTSEYPAPFAEINLRSMQGLAEQFQVPVGLSDHSKGIEIPLVAAGLGARVIEKHFTLDRNLEGPDHKASLEPAELASMIQGIRKVELALGSSDKKPTDSELKNKLMVRKSLVANRNIQKGESFTAENLVTKRPGSGTDPMMYWDFLGLPAKRDFKRDEAVSL